MARIRTIKPDFWRNEPLSEVSPEAALLAIGLLNHADDEGYFVAHPKLVESDIFPLRELSSTCTVLLKELSDIGYIELFTGSDGKKYGLITKFTKHQVVNKPKPSEIKEFRTLQDEYCTSTVGVRGGMEREREVEKEREREKEVEREGVAAGSQNDRKLPAVKAEKPTTIVWQAFKDAYHIRYGVEPIRNARVNGQLANMVKRLGGEHSAEVARFYLSHNNAYYVRQKHCVDAMLKDCEGLSTELRSGNKVTNTQAQMADRTQTNMDAFGALLAEAG